MTNLYNKYGKTGFFLEIKLAVGDLVYLFAPSAATLQTRSRKFKEDWTGPLQIEAVLDKSHYLLEVWQGKLMPIFGAVHTQTETLLP